MSTTDPFAEVPGPLRVALERRGFTALTAVQQAVLQADAEQHDLRVTSQTGSGKTVAFGLVLAHALLKTEDPPAGERPPLRSSAVRGLIITPTRELANQVCDELGWLLEELRDVRVDVVTGGTDLRAERRMLQRPPTLLVGTPGRLLDHIRAEALVTSGIRHVVLDEADRMLDMGFREELDAIIDALPQARRSHLVSATFAGPVQRIADRFQQTPLHLEGTTLGEANEDIDHVAQLVYPNQRYAALVNALLLAQGEQVLVFVDRRAEASELAELLAGDGFAALPFSGDLSQAQRNRTLHAFRTCTIQVLVCTDVAARGIDVPNITMVVHMSPPQNPDDYTHRSGRTGRAGRRGRSLLLVPPRAQRYVTRLLDAARISASWQAVPTPAKVRKAITKRTRRELHARLDAEAGPSDKTLEYATNLLEGRDAAVVVAHLLEQAEPRIPREPIAVDAVPPRRDRDDGDRRPFRSKGGRRPLPRGHRGQRHRRGAPRRNGGGHHEPR